MVAASGGRIYFGMLKQFFSRESDEVAVEQHLLAFEYFLDKFKIIYEDLALRMFCHSLKQGAQHWFQISEASSILSWQGFQVYFLDIGVSVRHMKNTFWNYILSRGKAMNQSLSLIGGFKKIISACQNKFDLLKLQLWFTI